MRSLLGGKGAGLAEMTRIGLPVPPGFTITTEVCTYYYDHKRSYPPQLARQVDEALAKVEKSVGKTFGGRKPASAFGSFRRPRFDAGHDGHDSQSRNERHHGRDRRGEESSNPKFAWDSYRRFLQMYGDVVMGVQKRPDEDHEPFESVIERSRTSDTATTTFRTPSSAPTISRNLFSASRL